MDYALYTCDIFANMWSFFWNHDLLHGSISSALDAANHVLITTNAIFVMSVSAIGCSILRCVQKVVSLSTTTLHVRILHILVCSFLLIWFKWYFFQEVLTLCLVWLRASSLAPLKASPNSIWGRWRRKSRPVAPPMRFFHPARRIFSSGAPDPNPVHGGATGGAGWARGSPRGPLSAARPTICRLHSPISSPLAPNNCTGGSFAQRRSKPSLRNTGWRKCAPRVHARRAYKFLSRRHCWASSPIRLKRIYNFWCSMLVYTPFALSFVTLRGVFMHFPELNEMPQRQFPVFCCFCVSEKLHRKYSRNWTKQKPKFLFFPKRDGVQSWDGGGPWAAHTMGWRRPAPGRATRWWGHLAHLLTPPFRLYIPLDGKTLSPDQFSTKHTVSRRRRRREIRRVQKLFPAPCRRGKSPPEAFFITMHASGVMCE
jgi:hypothetical protein